MKRHGKGKLPAPAGLPTPAKLPVPWILQGRHRKLKYAAAVVFLVGACVATLGMLAFASLTSTARYDLQELSVKQEGTGLELSWADAGAAGYAVILQADGDRPSFHLSDENQFRLELAELDRDYRVTVMAVSPAGGLSAARSAGITTQKLDQTIETEKDKYIGLEEKSRDLEAQAHGKMTYTSSDPGIVAVSRSGVMTFRHDGEARITIRAAEGKQYKAAEKTVAVTVYPDTLDTPEMTLSDQTKTTATLSWESVEYAKGYTLRRYDPIKGKYKDMMDFSEDTISVQLPRDAARYKLKATATVEDEEIESEPSQTVEVRSTADDAPSYTSAHSLGTLDRSNLDVVAHISGSGRASVPQSMSHVGKNYVITYVDHAGSTGALVTYSSDGDRLDTVGIGSMGVANGSTYSPVDKLIYTVKTHRAVRSATCSAYDPKTGSREHVFELPKVTSGIAFDESTGKYILSKGNELYLCDTDFNVEKFVWKRARYNHAQDIGAYNGVALVCTWVAGNESYIDLYRMSDGAYLGGYSVPIGEIESCFVDNKHLIILMNNGTGGLGDCILRTTEPIDMP